MNYFDDEEELEEPVADKANGIFIKLKYLSNTDFTGYVFNKWTILELVDHPKNIYKVKCACGREYVRKIYVIVNNKIFSCSNCYRKSRMFVRV